jgi:UPF0755 protein
MTIDQPNPQQQRKPTRALRHWLAASITLIGLGAAGLWLWWQQAIAPVQGRSVPPVVIDIAPGSSSDEIGSKLAAAGLIRSELAWKLWVRWQVTQDPQGSLQAGQFQLAATQPLDAIARKIWDGQVVQTQFTIPEGWSLRQMAEYFQAQGYFKAVDFLSASQTIPRQTYPWLPANIKSLEGFLYPDTYNLPAGQITPAQVIDTMLQQFGNKALPLYLKQAASPTKLSLLDWVTLSSIVEQETVVEPERALIAGVFWNRLRQKIPLGADPTVEYGLGIQQTPDQPLTYAQVQTPNPYNTYINVGLPPGPICSPASASLAASLNPAQTDYLYFVARYDETHVFSRTLAEHERAQTQIHDQRQGASPSR